jgi:hypothetical protein
MCEMVNGVYKVFIEAVEESGKNPLVDWHAFCRVRIADGQPGEGRRLFVLLPAGFGAPGQLQVLHMDLGRRAWIRYKGRGPGSLPFVEFIGQHARPRRKTGSNY